MIRRIFAAAAIAAFASFGGAAAQAPTQADLETLFQRYNALIGENRIDEALKLRTDEAQAEIAAERAKGTKQEQDEFLDMVRAMTPETFAADFMEMEGDDRATVYGVGAKVMPVGPDAGKTKRIEMIVEFVRADGGDWRIGTPTFLGDPDAVKRIEDTAYEPVDQFDQDREVNLGGRIVRVALESDHTLVVVRMLDEEQALYMPDQAFLRERGFNVELLRPNAMVEAEGHPHKIDPQKVWVTGLTVQ